MIFTSFFANYRNFPGDFVPVSIARFTPGYLKGNIRELKALAPSQELLMQFKRKEINEQDYILSYFSELNERIKNVLFVLTALDRANNHILLCYENKEEFCHRRLLGAYCQKYLNDLKIQFKEL